jgi:hypothetical protein
MPSIPYRLYAIMPRISFKFLGPACIALLACGSAYAQYSWLDENGRKQYSDQPPPASVPQSRILKEPRGAVKRAPAAGTSAPDAADAASATPGSTTLPAASGPATTADRNAEFNKRRIERAEKEKKAEEQEKLAAEKKRNCERAREYQRGLENGDRLVRTDKNGERAFLTDEQRERELKETRRILEDCR